MKKAFTKPLFKKSGRRLWIELGMTLLGCFSAGAMTTNVVFQNFAFTPQTVSIQVGDTVVWTNAGGVHTVTGDGQDPFCGSNAIPVTCSETFTKAGTFPYHCQFHGFLGMVGTVIVSSGSNTNPPPDTNRIVDPIPGKIPKGTVRIELQTVAQGLVAPIGAATPDDGSGRMFIYDQTGIIYVLQNGSLLPTPLLDVRDRLVPIKQGYDERGLIGLALHTNFSQFPFIYTYTSETNGPAADFPIAMPAGITNDHQQVIAEWRIDAANSNRVDTTTRRELLRLDKPQFNHNGGTMRFGRDGLLYFGVGDGGAADDQGPGHSPGGNGQDLTKILGKINRIDVDGRNSTNKQYGIPATNPFVGQSNAVAEIYAYGFRNPYSFSFDRVTGDLYAGDVGQNDVEEVDRVVQGGNFGWSIKEGGFYFDANGTNNGFVTSVPVREVPPGLIDPITQYDHDEGVAIIGGFLYRGSVITNLTGKYVTGDLGGTNLGRLFYMEGTNLTEFVIGTNDRLLGMYLKGFGEDASGELYVMGSTNIGPSGTAGTVFKIIPIPLANQSPNQFVQRNLVSDQPGLADQVDTNLVNAWGLAFSGTSPFWLSDNGSGVSSLYNSTGGVQSLVVTIPGPAGATSPATPTGIIFNGTTNFAVAGGPAHFIFATEDGTISGWNNGTNAVLTVDNSTNGAVYKGLALASNLLFAANFHAGTIDVFDAHFQPINPPDAFKDPNMPTNYAPFDVEVFFGDKLYVTYAQQNAEKHDDVAGPGNGFVDVYDLSGNFQTRLITGGPLNSPWGLAMAPATFAAFPGALLVGNFGDGAINAFNPTNGTFLGTLADAAGNPISIDGLWSIKFGNGKSGGDPNVLYFTAGPSHESHGLFGSIAPASYLRITAVSRNPNGVALTLVGGTPPYVIETKSDLNDTNWLNVLTTTNLGAVLPQTNKAGFFRVKDHAP
ncbi:MAG TPA: TIGR03118 family protein [Verrucomicrobiae bacterium]|nr:TIGR03118 family protein [Verrucomicrobiae bacterium]